MEQAVGRSIEEILDAEPAGEHHLSHPPREIAQSQPRRFVGQQDLPLTEQGREQMARLAEYLAGRSVTGL